MFSLLKIWKKSQLVSLKNYCSILLNQNMQLLLRLQWQHYLLPSTRVMTFQLQHLQSISPTIHPLLLISIQKIFNSLHFCNYWFLQLALMIIWQLMLINIQLCRTCYITCNSYISYHPWKSWHTSCCTSSIQSYKSCQLFISKRCFSIFYNCNYNVMLQKDYTNL